MDTPARPVKSNHHVRAAVHLSPKAIKADMAAVSGFNAKLAVLITGAVGTMACAYVFCLLALVSLPAILIEAGVLSKGDVPTFLTKPGLILVVAWIAQTLIQLVLLAVIMVGQDVQSKASDARSEKTFQDAELLLDRLDMHTVGGIKDLHDALIPRLDALEAAAAPRSRKKATPNG